MRQHASLALTQVLHVLAQDHKIALAQRRRLLVARRQSLQEGDVDGAVWPNGHHGEAIDDHRRARRDHLLANGDLADFLPGGRRCEYAAGCLDDAQRPVGDRHVPHSILRGIRRGRLGRGWRRRRRHRHLRIVEVVTGARRRLARGRQGRLHRRRRWRQRCLFSNLRWWLRGCLRRRRLGGAASATARRIPGMDLPLRLVVVAHATAVSTGVGSGGSVGGSGGALRKGGAASSVDATAWTVFGIAGVTRAVGLTGRRRRGRRARWLACGLVGIRSRKRLPTRAWLRGLCRRCLRSGASTQALACAPATRLLIGAEQIRSLGTS
mmetsp:Transcript_30699/g.102146  ORF Transcript_30699/g.102146 Transcript_30699/m.102146 type:complete len:323 (+) Transcript_30699:2705-3673(+)